MEVDIYLNKTVEQNAEIYYEKSKKAKKKLKGAIEAVERFSKTLDKLEDVKIEHKELTRQRKRLWFEKFRWFISSTGFLVIGGRDATTNEIAIKKHTEKDDIVLHTDMAGSPFFVIKADKKKIDKKTISEAADATCSFSRAWKLGLNTQSVFYVNPDQVSKEANPGEYLPKGAFMIRGKTNYINNKTNLTVGKIKDGEYKGLIMCAPLEAVKKHCEKSISLVQGDKKPSDIAKKIKKQLKYPNIDDIIRVFPSGGVEISKK